MPLIKSLLHFKDIEKPPKTAAYFDAHLTLAIGVLNSPMIGVQVTSKSNNFSLLPWVRVTRHLYLENISDTWERSKFFAIDLVHKDFFQNYIEKHALPFASDYSSLIVKHQEILATGKAFVSNMDGNSSNIESKLTKI